MPSFSTEVPHQIGQEDATNRLKGFMDKVRNRYKDQVSDLSESWEENVLTFAFKSYGFKISGTLTVEDAAARLDGKLPFAAVAFKGKIQQSIATELEKVLA